ncbi:MAG: 3-phosphoshikimate 1-carboxyvinyltransferase [Gemmatimonadales bacterium]
MPHLRVPGDKSITHRLLILASLARGRSVIRGALASLDTRSSAACLRQLGARVGALRQDTDLEVTGLGRLRQPRATLHCGNSGTTARLLLGALAGHRVDTRLTGDASLRRRPMRRVTDPLERMGATCRPAHADRLPLSIQGGRLTGIEWQLPVSSAQIKSALLMAGVTANVGVRVREPAGRSRDHTERLLRAFGYAVRDDADGWIDFAPSGRLVPFELGVPGDASSAAFLVAAGLLRRSGQVTLAGVGLNPTRLGFLDVLRRMNARLDVGAEGESLGEPVGTIRAGPSDLRGTEVAAKEIPGLIDEIPALAILASRALGETVFRSVGELRLKESDRLELLARNLRAVGAAAEVSGDDLVVGGEHAGPPRGRVTTEGDHRLAMAFGVLGTLDGARVEIDDRECAGVSFPGFWKVLAQAAG